MDIEIFKTPRELAKPGVVHIWAEGVVIPFRLKTHYGRRIVVAGKVNERYKWGAHTRAPHNYFVAPAAFAAACDKAKEYFRKNPPEKKGVGVVPA